jgi:cytosine/adenosine deaminase-related metal-dependent hydrolase
MTGAGEALVRAAWVLTMGPRGEVRDGAVHVRDGAVAAVGPYAELRAALPAVEVVGDGTGIVAPGLVNLHTHLSEALVPGMGSELSLFEWGTRVVTPVGAVLTAEDAREGTLLRAVELLRSGVTCVNDLFVHGNPGAQASLGVVEGLERAGLRGVVSFGPEDLAAPLPVERLLDEHRALAAAAAATGLVGFRFGIGTLLGSSDALLDAGLDLCRDEGWGVHTHLAEVREEVVATRLRWGRRPVEQAAALGLLDLDLVAAHAIWVTEDEVALLAGHGVAVAHNPVANMILGSGVCPVPRLRAAGVTVGVGTDGAASNDSQNMLEAVKAAALLQKVAALDPAVLSAGDVLEMATIGGARALGLDDRIGSLEPGKRADLVLFQGSVEVATIHDPAAQVVYGASPRAVRDVWVDGRRLVCDGQVVTVDEAEQAARCRPLAARVAAEAGLIAEGVSRLCAPS